jgi:hypothetical protein
MLELITNFKNSFDDLVNPSTIFPLLELQDLASGVTTRLTEWIIKNGIRNLLGLFFHSKSSQLSDQVSLF